MEALLVGTEDGAQDLTSRGTEVRVTGTRSDFGRSGGRLSGRPEFLRVERVSHDSCVYLLADQRKLGSLSR